MSIRIGINGFGRIGNLAFQAALSRKDVEVVAINDPFIAADYMAYMVKYDTVHGKFEGEISSEEGKLIVNGKEIKVYNEMEPKNIPWGKDGVDYVLECSGVFTTIEKANAHLEAGAKKVIISAPAKGDIKTIVYNVNDNILDGKEEIISAASCTTNCLAPVLKVLDDNFGIEKGFMTTVHAYTNDQVTLDVAHKKGIESRRGRACAANIVPTSTGAASAIGSVIPSLKGKLKGGAMRVPVSDGSMIDLTLELKTNVTEEEINNAFKESVNETLNYTDDPVVSSDIIGSSCGALVDGQLTCVLDVDGKQLVKVVAWYDNEMGYSYQMVRTAKKLMK